MVQRIVDKKKQSKNFHCIYIHKLTDIEWCDIAINEVMLAEEKAKKSTE